MYAPPALGYALIVWRYEKTRITSSATIPSESGTSAPNASAPAPPISRTVSISSVAYATEESASLANTASAVLLPRRSWISWSVRILRPNIMFARFERRERGRTGVAVPTRRSGSPRWCVPAIGGRDRRGI